MDMREHLTASPDCLVDLRLYSMRRAKFQSQPCGEYIMFSRSSGMFNLQQKNFNCAYRVSAKSYP